MNPKEIYYETLSKTIISNLNKRQMEGYYCPTRKEAVEKALSFLTPSATVSYGGSMTLEETGMLDALRSDKTITLLDRSTAKDAAEMKKIYHDALSADFYFMSTNALTKDGKLVNIDGNGNRVAALIYGPENVIVLAGMNKIVTTEEEAVSRVHQTAAPINCLRLGKKTPCSTTGICADCLSPDCICNQTVVTRRSGIPGRIKVILIGEDFGY